MTTFTLTGGADSFIGSSADDTVNGTAATLNPADSLDGGGGHDLLALSGAGTFDLSALAQFDNFEQVIIDGLGLGSPIDLTLRDGADLTVDFDTHLGGINGNIHLADGDVTINLGHGATSFGIFASTGATTINVNDNDSSNIFLSTGDATIDEFLSFSAEDFTAIHVASGKTTIDFSGNVLGTSPFPTHGRVTLTDVSILDYDDVFIGSSTAFNDLHAEGSGALDLGQLNLAGLWTLYLNPSAGNNVTADLDQTNLAHLVGIFGQGTLTTAAATLDLTSTKIGVTLASTNAGGTSFTVADAASGMHVVGGPGNDTVIASGFAFTQVQRNAIFAQGSVETIQDTSGTYSASAVTTLTPNADVFSGTAIDNTVNATAATLNAADSLDGGGGHDVLALFGTGTFDLSALAQFDNFEQIVIDSVDLATVPLVDLILRDGADLTVDFDTHAGGSNGNIHLADGDVTINLGQDPTSSTSYTIFASTGTTTINIGSTDSSNIFLSSGEATITEHLNLSIGGRPAIHVWSGKTTIDFTDNTIAYPNVYPTHGTVILSDVSILNYDDVFIGSNAAFNDLQALGSGELDLRQLHLEGPWTLFLLSGNLTADLDQTSLSHLVGVFGDGNLTTAAATLDLTSTKIGATLASTNAGGTSFTVADAASGAHIIGGPGNDTIIGAGFAFTQAQRDAIFAQGSVETIQDTSGTYSAPPPTSIVGGPGDDFLIGTSGKDIIDGREGADYMAGGAGNDVYYVDNAGDQVVENPHEGNDIVYATFDYTLGANVESVVLQGAGNINAAGNSLVNALIGNSGNNALDGKGGADYMVGGAGNDIYYVDSAGDQVVENPNEGNDIVYATFDYTLGANVESVVLVQGVGHLNAAGNSADNALVGNSDNNALDGKGGADHMVGGAGNDIYYVDNAGDEVVENPNQGNDIVYATFDYTLGANVESVVLVEGAGNINAAGNNDVNALIGNSGNNALDGKGGDDHMVGGAGNDIYYVDSAGDEVVENPNEGNDIVYATFDYTLGANVESVVLVEGAGNINAAGNSDGNALVGNSGDNVLDGRGGVDYLVGNAGNDTFRFQSGEADGDVIADFDGAGTSLGDSLVFSGFGTGPGATFTQIGSSNEWQIHSGLDGHNEVIALQNGASVHPNDYSFV